MMSDCIAQIGRIRKGLAVFFYDKKEQVHVNILQSNPFQVKVIQRLRSGVLENYERKWELGLMR